MNNKYTNKDNNYLWVIIIVVVILGAYWFGLKQQPQTEFDACYDKCMVANQDMSKTRCVYTCSPQQLK